MPRWAYMFVELEMAKDGKRRPMMVNGEGEPNWPNGPGYEEFADQLGREGWELVSVGFTGYDGKAGWLAFKRPC